MMARDSFDFVTWTSANELSSKTAQLLRQHEFLSKKALLRLGKDLLSTLFSESISAGQYVLLEAALEELREDNVTKQQPSVDSEIVSAFYGFGRGPFAAKKLRLVEDYITFLPNVIEDASSSTCRPSYPRLDSRKSGRNRNTSKQKPQTPPAESADAKNE